MSDRLPINEERNSYSAALGYRTDNAFYTLEKNVVVVRNGRLLINGVIPVSVSDHLTHMSINILWEEAGYTNFKDLGLYGSYGSSYYRMTYIDGILTIKSDSDDNVEIVIR